MPKIKTNRGAAKRFKRTGSGQYKFRRAYRNHILTKKKMKLKRHLRSTALIHKSDLKGVKDMLNDK